MLLLIWIFVYLGFARCSSDNTLTLCFHHADNFSSICNVDSTSLSCNEDHFIRIRDIQIRKNTNGNIQNCTDCRANSNSSQWDLVEDILYFETLLYQACSRKNQCNFSEDMPQSYDASNFIWTANITYDCIEKDLFKDVCSPRTLETDSVHIVLNTSSDATSNCSCTIIGSSENVTIEAVDYRPYINDIDCAGNSVEVDCIDIFQCTENGTDFSIYNTEIATVNNVTTMIFLFAEMFPKMIWFHIKGINMTVQCNNVEYSPISCTKSTVDDITTNTFSTLTDTVPQITSTEVTNVETTFPLLRNEGTTDESIFSLPVIAGGSAGLLALIVIIAFIICIFCKRKLRKAKKCMDKENMRVKYNAQLNTANVSTIKYENVNQGNEKKKREVNITMSKRPDLNYEEVGESTVEEGDGGSVDNDTEYAEPVDVVADYNYSETGTSIPELENDKNKIPGHNYTEPYDQTVVIDDESKSNYAKVMKNNRKKESYDSCPGIDNYSHIQLHNTRQAPITEDTYSHIHISGNENEIFYKGNYSHTKVNLRDDSPVQSNAGMYNHVEMDDVKQKTPDNKETEGKAGHTNNTEQEDVEEEYDHLNNFSHH